MDDHSRVCSCSDLWGVIEAMRARKDGLETITLVDIISPLPTMR